jgi:hypothetical protein
MLYRTLTDRPIAKLRATGWLLLIAALLPAVNAGLAHLGLSPIGTDDVPVGYQLVLAAYSAVAGLVAWVAGYLRRPDVDDVPVRDTAASLKAWIPVLVFLSLAGPAAAQPSYLSPDREPCTVHGRDYGMVADSDVLNYWQITPAPLTR